MHRSRALTVRVMAGAATAAALFGLIVPAAKLWAQKTAEAPKSAPTPADSPPSPSAEKPTSLPDGPSPPAPIENLPPPSIPTEVPVPQGSVLVLPSPSSPTPSPSVVPFDDPEGSARSFVEKSQKEADDAIKALTREAETLRGRLQKVEAGLARWQAVKGALEAHGGGRPGWRSPDEGIPEPRMLEPIPQPGGRPGPSRGRRGVAPPIRDDEPAPRSKPAPTREIDPDPAPVDLPPARTAPPTPKRDASEPAGDLPKAAASPGTGRE